MSKSTNDSIEKKDSTRIEKTTNKKNGKNSTKKTNSVKSKVLKEEKVKKTSTKKTSSTKRTTTKKTSTTSKTKSTKSVKKEKILTNLEYYDLPYRYNQTIVKILAQTPNTLFVYWDISDDDRKNLETTFGNDFFYNTKPVLIIHNETKNYSFEVEINDFANSWYLHISDTDCKYNIELGRRFFKIDTTNNENSVNTYKGNNYIYISSSNKLVTPNDHILVSSNQNTSHVQFKNIKNNTYFSKEIKNIELYSAYKELYSKEELNTLQNNPSSNFKKM